MLVPSLMLNATDFQRDTEFVMHGAGYLVAYVCITLALIVCFVFVLFSLSLLLEMLGRAGYEVYVRAGNIQAARVVGKGRNTPGVP